MNPSRNWWEFLRFSKNFLVKSQLRSLRNAVILPPPALIKVLDSLDLTFTERMFLIQYLEECFTEGDGIDALNFWTFFMSDSKKREVEDPYIYCYTSSLELTHLGQRMKNESYREQAQRQV